MNKKQGSAVAAALLSSVLAFSAPAFADDGDGVIPCSTAINDNVDALFGPALDGTPASDLTQCIQVRKRLKIVVAWNTDALNTKKNYPQQVVNVENMVSQYETDYKLPRSQYDIVVVAYQSGAKSLLTNAGYDAHHGTADPDDAMVPNPSLAAVTGLLAKGIKFYACQNTMKGNGYKTRELIPGVEMVPGGVTAFLDYQFQGYKPITP